MMEQNDVATKKYYTLGTHLVHVYHYSSTPALLTAVHKMKQKRKLGFPGFPDFMQVINLREKI